MTLARALWTYAIVFTGCASVQYAAANLYTANPDYPPHPVFVCCH